MRHASLFSGIGGPEVAAAMLGWENVFHCEINPFGRKILDYWFPNSKSYEDITKTSFKEWRGKVDVLTGGFPCQPFSYAGQRRGADDDRYLWPHMFRAIDEIRPAWVVAENVAGITTMVEQGEVSPMGGQAALFEEVDDLHRYRYGATFTLERICADLESHGYQVQPVLVPACAVGAPHRRDRVFIVAHIAADTYNAGNGTQRQGGRERQAVDGGGQDQPLAGAGGLGEGISAADSDSHGHPAQAENQGTEGERRGNDGQPRQRGEQTQRADGLHGVQQSAADTDSRRRGERKCEMEREFAGRHRADGNGRERTAADTPNNGLQHNAWRGCEEEVSGKTGGGREDGISVKIKPTPADGCGRTTADTYSALLQRWYGEGASEGGQGQGTEPLDSKAGCGRWDSFPSVSPVHRGNDGIPFDVDGLAIPFSKWRTESLKAYGNAIVPQVMYEIFRAIEITTKSQEQ